MKLRPILANSSFYSPDKRRFLFKQDVRTFDWFRSTPYLIKVDALQVGQVVEVQNETKTKTFKIRRIK